MKKSNKRLHFNIDNNVFYENDENDKNNENEKSIENKNYEHINKFIGLKKRKLDNQIDDISSCLNNFNINNIGDKDIIEENIETMNNTENNILDNIENNDNMLKKKLDEKIKYIDELKNLILFDKYFNYNSLILLTNYLVKKHGDENVIQGKITNNEFQKIIWENICLIVYPSFLFDPLVFESSLEDNYVDVRIKNLDEISPDTKSFFPTWKKIYNFDIDYDFNEANLHHKKICKNFLKKIFEYYEIIYKIYFNVIFGEIFSFILQDYQIILNPFDIKFKLDIFNKWNNSFNVVLDSIKKYITNIAKSISLEKIDELSQEDLTKLIMQIKKDFVDEFETTSKNDIVKLFEPLKIFVDTNQNSIIYSQNKVSWNNYNSKCLNNIDKEIILLFKQKYYLNILSKNKWIRKFIY